MRGRPTLDGCWTPRALAQRLRRGMIGGGRQIRMASVLRFCTIAARWNSSRAPEASQPHSLEAMMVLEVSKPYLDFLPLVGRSVELRGADQCAGEVAGILVDVSRDLAKRHLRTALRFKLASIATALGRKVAQHVVVADIACRREQLAGRADLGIALAVECEVAAREGAVLRDALVPDRDLRRDAGAGQPA